MKYTVTIEGEAAAGLKSILDKLGSSNPIDGIRLCMTVVDTLLGIDKQGGCVFVRSADGTVWWYAPFTDGENILHEASVKEVLGK